MNYRINEKSSTISIYGELSEKEKITVGVYINQGFKLIPSEKKKRRVKKDDILNWFDNNNNSDGKAKFEKDIKSYGYLKAVPRFREDYPNAWEEIKASINKD